MHIMKDVLKDWFSRLQFLKSEGFKVDFIAKSLKSITHVCLGVEARRVKHDIKSQIQTKMKRLCN